MDKVAVMLISNEDWNEKYDIPAHITIKYFKQIDPRENRLQDLVIIDRNISKDERLYLEKVTRAFCLFVTENAELNEELTLLLDERKGKRLYTGDLDAFWVEEAVLYFPEPYGERFHPDRLQVNKLFNGKKQFIGKFSLELEGDFGSEFAQIVCWNSNIPIFKEKSLDFYLEYDKDGDVQIKLNIFQFYEGSVDDIAKTWTFDEEQLKDVFTIENNDCGGPLFVSILAKGTGKLIIKSLHDRHSRKSVGYFLPGGERYVTSSGEEIFVYLDSGDMKPPIAYYFSAFRKPEGFEGYFMMRKLGCPVVLITDPRLEGGGFYIGDDEYEELMINIIKKYMKLFNAREDQVILSGTSMGTYASMYYGCDIRPHAICLSKPIANAGILAANETLLRVGIFPSSLDVLLKAEGALDQEARDRLDKRFWDKFKKADWSKTKFMIGYCYEDDYDMEAYSQILENLNSSGVQVYGKGVHGRHNDHFELLADWFRRQLNKILVEDFGRGND